jgi:hypothetical protein
MRWLVSLEAAWALAWSGAPSQLDVVLPHLDCHGAGALEQAVGHPAALPAASGGTGSWISVAHSKAALSLQVLLCPVDEAFPSPIGSCDGRNCEIPGKEKSTVESSVKVL